MVSNNVGEVIVWTAFLGQMALLQRMSFDVGLPMRGAIDVGEFYIRENNFAGRPIINSFRQAQMLNFSGCVLTQATSQLLFEKLSKWRKEWNVDFFEIFKALLMPYSAPLKGNANKRLLLLNWFSANLVGEGYSLPLDIRQYVNTAFHDHNKEINDSVTPKIENTERILRWMKELKWDLNENCLQKV